MPAMGPGFSLDPPENVLGGGVCEIRIDDLHQVRQPRSWEALASIQEDNRLVVGHAHGGFCKRDRGSRLARDDGEDVASADPARARDQGGRAIIAQHMWKNRRRPAPVGNFDPALAEDRS